ncbi:MAG: DegT/DnrJ/EryC1/StrS family aminotransferase [Planctomycetaceae bacterium]|jgi:dTDP-4-amino-4,6-dideoxygalactose transaminase|nr:DegT/DnrJ/EryC1/StrS family aminotransferase [Planctomycetaceae bacterium]MBT6156046.1 DegT/DnrJ/EryC1/StrS family aminotransferase [Planctomycetaceae bacterium]MBT6487513.1 DegT/DnrJ/EryC1/StrS family aminotransferase [Planctomycetaceae bacterium]MBT6495860.1 DegT/DnrJ/EryC1/StrS family aminotransferase [Planctomycetaceae bacterium]
MIPLCDLKLQYASLSDDINEAMLNVAAEARYILGPNVRALEQEIAEYCGCPHAVGVGSGTDALHLALKGLGVGPGDEVITTPFTFVATTEAIGMVGATPIFVDIDPLTFNMDVSQIESRITPKTKAILPVHLYGQSCNMDVVMDVAQRHGLAVVEDCAQAIGATWRGRPVGSIGDAGCLSFFPSKNLGCFGDGGMLVTNRADVYERVEMLRRHGGRVKYHHEVLGLNSRLDELQAAILRVKFRHLPQWLQSRREAAYTYNALLSEGGQIEMPQELTDSGYVTPQEDTADDSPAHCVYHQYTVQTDHRDELIAHLKNKEVGHAVYYPIPLHLQEVHQDLGYEKGSFPIAERIADRCLSLPMFPEITRAQIECVVDALKESYGSEAPQRAVA